MTEVKFLSVRTGYIGMNTIFTKSKTIGNGAVMIEAYSVINKEPPCQVDWSTCLIY